MESINLDTIEQAPMNNVEEIEENINMNLTVHLQDTLQRMSSKDAPMSEDAVEYHLEQEESIELITLEDYMMEPIVLEDSDSVFDMPQAESDGSDAIQEFDANEDDDSQNDQRP